jgi:hypothetical protein
MTVTVKCVDYFYVTVQDKPGEAYKLLAKLASADINLLAFGIVPMGTLETQLTLFPEHTGYLANAVDKLGLTLQGPRSAILVQGDDKLGALIEIHRKLSEENINIYASNGVTDNKGGYGYIIYLRPEDLNRAAELLDASRTC